MNRIVTIPHQKVLSKTRELVLITKKEYELLLERSTRAIPEISLTARQKKVVEESERELKVGKYRTLTQLRYDVERTHSRAYR